MSDTVAIVVCGAAGRMGRRIIALACEGGGFEVKAAIEAAGHPALGADAGETAGTRRLGVAIRSDFEAALDPAAVVIDFTSPEATLEHMRAAARTKAPMVVGTTGLSPEQRAEAERLGRATATVLAPNMSLGVNVLLGLVEDAVRRLGPAFDCEIFEVHHGRKKDAPSGTALALAEAAARGGGLDPKQAIRSARDGLVGERPQKEIGVFALRGGDAVGDHTVMLLGTGERLELTHRASSRDCLASGALRAAAWVAKRPAGLYTMRDVVSVDAPQPRK